jgi:hypothetical protein
MQVLLSDEIRDRVIERFDLMKHYEIDPMQNTRLLPFIKNTRKISALNQPSFYQ